MSVKYGKIDWL